MNTKTLCGLGILMAIGSACTNVEQELKDDTLITKEQKEVIISATVENQPETKTVLNSDNLSVLWRPADEIKVFSAGEASKFTSQNSEDQKAVNFKGTISVITGTAEGTDIDTHIYGLYPYTESATMTDGSFTTELPAVQTGLAGSFDDDLFISIGRSYTFSMGFWNVCSGYRFSFTEAGYQSVTLTSNDGTPLAGTFVVTFDDAGKPDITANPTPSASVTVNAPEGGFLPNTWYYLVVLPGTHTEGITFTATNASGTGTYAINEEKTFNRSKFKQVKGLDEMLEVTQATPPNNEIWYTSSNNEVVVPTNNDVFGARILENIYEDGKGIITFDGNVSTIGDEAFFGCENLTSITLPDGLTCLGRAAFYNCSNLTGITIPNGVTSIENSAFGRCLGFSSITIPDGVTRIGDNAFMGCENLTSITLPKRLTSIGDSAFSCCYKLIGIIIPESVTDIGSSAFEGCWALDHIVLGNGITRLEYGTFSYCSSLTNITIPDGVTSIGNYAFHGCRSLTNITMPDGLTIIESSAFWECQSLTGITLPEGMTTIGDSAFDGCTSLSGIFIPEGVTSIGECAFRDCKSLTSITIPNGVMSIGRYAFRRCSNLITMTVLGQIPPEVAQNAFSECDCSFMVPVESYQLYKDASDWSDYLERINPIIPDEPTTDRYYGGWYISADEGDSISFHYSLGDHNDGDEYLRVYVGSVKVYEDHGYGDCSGDFSYCFEEPFTGWLYMDWGWSCYLNNITSDALVIGRGQVYGPGDLAFNDSWSITPSYVFDYIQHNLTVHY